MDITLYTLASRYVGIRELSGAKHHPLIVWWHSLCDLKDAPDETPWCSSFLNGMAWELRLPRSKSAAARSWLDVGTPVEAQAAVVGWDVVVLRRGKAPQPGPDVTRGASGHVGLFAGWSDDSGTKARVMILGGNQGDEVSIASFPATSILGVRRLL